jgi:hypothetical protein
MAARSLYEICGCHCENKLERHNSEDPQNITKMMDGIEIGMNGRNIYRIAGFFAFLSSLLCFCD